MQGRGWGLADEVVAGHRWVVALIVVLESTGRRYG